MFQSEFNLGVLGMDIMALFGSLMWASFYCYFGNLATDHVSAIGDAAYNLNWFEYPVQIQKYVILIIARTTRRVEFSGFQLITCSMEMFGKVFILNRFDISFQDFNIFSF